MFYAWHVQTAQRKLVFGAARVVIVKLATLGPELVVDFVILLHDRPLRIVV